MWCWNKPLRIWVPHYIQMLWYTQNLTHCARSSPLKCIHIYRHWQPLTTSPTTIHTWLDLHNSFLFPCFHLGPSMAQPSASSQQSLFTCNQTMFLFYWKPPSSIPAWCKSQSLSGLQTPAAQASHAICDLTSQPNFSLPPENFYPRHSFFLHDCLPPSAPPSFCSDVPGYLSNTSRNASLFLYPGFSFLKARITTRHAICLWSIFGGSLSLTLHAQNINSNRYRHLAWSTAGILVSDIQRVLS